MTFFLLFSFIFFLLSKLMLLPNRTAYSRTFLILFSHFSTLTFHYIVPLLVDGHSSFTMLLSNSGMIRCHLACPSPSDGHDLPSLSVVRSDILLFVSVTELLPLVKFSRHTKSACEFDFLSFGLTKTFLFRLPH